MFVKKTIREPSSKLRTCDSMLAEMISPSMMEPDSREMTNEKGFCKNHIKMLFDRNNRLSLALMLETHIKELEKSMEIPKKAGMFSKESPADIFSRNLYKKATSCALCEKLDSQMSDAAENFAHLWASEADFRKMFEKPQKYIFLNFFNFF